MFGHVLSVLGPNCHTVEILNIRELWGKDKESDIYIYTHTSCKYVGPLPASYCRTQNWYKFGKAWYFPAWGISWVWSFSSVVLGHLAGSPSLDRFFLSHRPGFGAKVFSTEESSTHVKEGNMTEIICCHGKPLAGIFWISQNPWVKLWPGVTPLTSQVSTTCVSTFCLMNHQSCQMRNAPRIVGKGGILEAFGVGAVCCNWASLLDFHWTKSGKPGKPRLFFFVWNCCWSFCRLAARHLYLSYHS